MSLPSEQYYVQEALVEEAPNRYDWLQQRAINYQAINRQAEVYVDYSCRKYSKKNSFWSILFPSSDDLEFQDPRILLCPLASVLSIRILNNRYIFQLLGFPVDSRTDPPRFPKLVKVWHARRMLMASYRRRRMLRID